MKNRRSLSIFILLLALVASTFAQPAVQYARELNSALQLERANRWDDALEAFRAYSKHVPTDQNAWLGIGRVLVKLRKYNDLEQHWKTILPSAPPHLRFTVETELGVALWMNGNLAGARAQWDAALNRQRSDGSYQQLANTLQSYSITEEAIRILLDGRGKLRNNSLFAYNLLQLYLATLNPRAAALEAANQIKLNPASGDQWNYWLTQFGTDSSTVSALVTTLNSEFHTTNARDAKASLSALLASIHFRSGIFSDAIIQTSIADSLSNSRGNRLLQLTHQLLSENAIETARKALALASGMSTVNSPEVLDLQGTLAIKSGDTTAARIFWMKHIEQFPNFPRSEAIARSLARSYQLENSTEAWKWAMVAAMRPNRLQGAESNCLLIEIALSNGEYQRADSLRLVAVRSNSPDLPQWMGRLAFYGFYIRLLSPISDSIVTQSLEQLNAIRFDDVAGVDALRFRILWSAIAKHSELCALVRLGEREYVQHRPNSVAHSIAAFSDASPEARLEALIRVAQWLSGSEQSSEILMTLKSQFPTEPRLAELLLTNALRCFRKGDSATAIREVEWILDHFAGRPEAETARKYLREWSHEG